LVPQQQSISLNRCTLCSPSRPSRVTRKSVGRAANANPANRYFYFITAPMMFTETLRSPKFVRLELACFDVAGIFLNVAMPLFGKVVQREDRRNWADRHTGAAVDTLDRVNEELVNRFKAWATVFVLEVLLRMDAVHGAGIHAGRIFSPDTGFC